MSRWLFAALAAAMVSVAAPSSDAADLGYRDYGNRHGSAYDDPRYADLYGDAPPAPRQPERHYYTEPRPHHGYGHSYPPIPREPIYRDRGSRYDDRRYSEAYPRDRAYTTGPTCLNREAIRHGLERDGWHDFRDPQVIDQGTAALTARRQGRTFQLKVDRCSGDVLAARPLDQYRPYADYGYKPYRHY